MRGSIRSGQNGGVLAQVSHCRPRATRATLALVALWLILLALPAPGRSQPLTVGFSCAPSCNVAVGATVTFSASSNAQAANYAWDLSGNQPPTYQDATGPTAETTFDKPGTYAISLQVTDGSDQETATVTHDVVVGPLSVDFSCSPSCRVPAGTPLSFTATSNAGAPSYYWNLTGQTPGSFGDAKGPSADNTYQYPGAYQVSVEVIDGATGQSAAATHEVDITNTKAAQILTQLTLLDTPVGKLILGPEHDQPGAPNGPGGGVVIPRGALPPRLAVSGTHHTVRVGSVVRLRLLTRSGRGGNAAWDLDGDGLANDGFGSSVAFPVTCPGTNVIRAQATGSDGLSGGAQIILNAAGRLRVVPPTALALRARRAHGSLDIGSHYGAWQRSGAAFGSQVMTQPVVPIERTLRTDGNVGGSFANLPAPVGAVGRDWATSWRTARGVRDLSVDAAGESATGELISPQFVISKRYLSYRLGGRAATCHGHPQETVTIYLLRRGRLVAMPHSMRTPGAEEQMQPQVISVPAKDRNAAAILVAADASSAGHINLDGLDETANYPHFQPLPVVGFADTHEHLDAHQSFGGLAGIRTYMGVPGGAYSAYEPSFNPSSTPAQRIAAAVRYATDMRDSQTHFATSLVGSLIMAAAHSFLAGSSQFEAFHEQFHITELHRAWEGGMRLISSLAVSNDALQYLMSAPYNSSGNVTLTPDRDVILAHVEAMRQLAAQNSSWMQIVYDPVQARRAIAEGKLAVVLGTEVDTLNSLGFSTPQQEVDWLWQLGIRQVTPIHSINNSIGGAAIFQDVYDMGNDLVNRHDPHTGYSTTQATTNEIADGINNNGLEEYGRPNAAYGDFFHTSSSNQCVWGTGYATPTLVEGNANCVDYDLNPLQLSLGMGGLGLPETRTPIVVGANVTNGGGDLPPLLATAHSTPGPSTGGLNTLGLTSPGEQYIDDLEHHGMLVDMEHMSDASIANLLAPSSPGAARSPAWQFSSSGGCTLQGSNAVNAAGQHVDPSTCFAQAYPFMSSHTSFRNQSLRPGQTLQKGYMRREFERTDPQIDYIDRAGGTIAPVILQDPNNVDDPFDTGALRHHTSYTNPAVPSLNDCAGSSKSFLQAYLWAINHTTEHHIALSTDMAVVGGTGPRFNPPHFSSAVWNNCPASSANELAGLNGADGGLDASKIANLVGAALSGPSQFQSLLEQYLRQGIDQEERLDPSQYQHTTQANPINYSDGPVTGANMRIDQPPAGPARNFNYTGAVTIGQLPDLIQDLLNDGMDPRDLHPLMSSAQAYLDMWDKAYRLNGCVDANDNPTSIYYTRCAYGPTYPVSASVCRNTCPNDPGDGSTLDPSGRPFNYNIRLAVPAAEGDARRAAWTR